jgi:hypothetical protein
LRAFRDDATTLFTNSQATALAGRLYWAWAGGEKPEQTIAVEQGPDGTMPPVPHDPGDDAAHFEAALVRLVRIETICKYEMDKPRASRNPFDLDHLPQPDECPDALEARHRNAQGDYTLDPKAERFPAWVSPNAITTQQPAKGGSLISLVEGWWVEPKARNLKPSSYESYSNSMKAFVALAMMTAAA